MVNKKSLANKMVTVALTTEVCLLWFTTNLQFFLSIYHNYLGLLNVLLYVSVNLVLLDTLCHVSYRFEHTFYTILTYPHKPI